MKKTGQVFMACVIGAGLGALIALQIAHAFWWVGVIAGFVTGYLSYEVKTVGRAIKSAWQKVKTARPPSAISAKIAGLSVLYVLNVLVWMSLWACLTAVLFEEADSKPLGFVAVIFAFTSVLGLLLLTRSAQAILPDEKPLASDALFAQLKKQLYIVSVPTVIFWHIPRGPIFVIRKIPTAAVVFGEGAVWFFSALARFFWLVFLKIHSEVRLLCGLDAMVGAAIGYFAGSAVIGAVAGGALGVINYALVTERWLKRRGYLPIRS